MGSEGDPEETWARRDQSWAQVGGLASNRPQRAHPL